MTQQKQVYKCEICGNIIEVLHNGQGELVCCGQSMVLQEAKDKDEGTEKHLPVVQSQNGNTIVKIGEVEHPMEKQHYIEWIEIVGENKCSRKKLSFGETPQAAFNIEYEIKEVRAYCNVHGLWSVTNLV